MNEDFPYLLEADDEGMRVGIFMIGLMASPKQGGEPITEQDMTIIFVGDITTASALIALGIIQNNAVNKQQSILLHNPKTKIVFPRQYG